ncbi:MAG: DUF3857 domain-containing protein [Dysgonomonas sp.]
MKSYLLSLSFLMLTAMPATSQENYSQEFGKVTQYEISMTEYGKDKDAEAVVLYDLGSNYFVGDYDKGFILRMERSVKIKILKQAGIEYGNFEIPYYIDGNLWEEIEYIEGATYNMENGKLIKTSLDKTKIYEEKINNNWKVKKFAMPAVKEGSIVELKYKINTPFFVNMRKWEFQKKIPVIYSKLAYKAMPYYEYSYILKGASRFDEFNSEVLNGEIQFGNLRYKEVQFNFGMKDVPAFKDEEFISSSQDYMIGLDFQLSKIYFATGGFRTYISTWPEMCNDFLKDDQFGKYINNCEKEAKKILPALNITGKSQQEQLEEINNYVKNNFNWNQFNDKYSSQKIGDLLKTKTGNAADLNLFMLGLLKAAGLKAEAVVLSTRNHGAINKLYPFRQFLNYVIVKVSTDSNDYFLDATEPLLCYNELPQRCINVEGLVIKPKVEEWTLVLQKGISTTEKTLNIKILPEENKLDVDVSYRASGYDAYRYRNAYLNKIDNLTDYVKKDEKLITISDLKVDENKDLNEPFTFSYKFSFALENAGNKIFINPFCNLAINNNPFKQSSRTLPVDLIYLRGESYKAVIEIPAGYRVESLPTSVNHNGKQIIINYTPTESNGKIEIKANYEYKQNIYEAKFYIPLKVSMSEAIKRFSDMIVLVKDSAQE